MKTCSKCSELKALTEFHKNKSRKDGLAHACKDCASAATRANYAANVEKRRKYRHEYYAKNSTAVKAYQATKRVSQSDEDREAQAEYLREWRRDNHFKVKSYRQAQRAKREEAFVEQVPFEAIWNRDNGVCQLCDCDIDRELKYPHWDSATLDHIIPLSKGGEHKMTNVQLACWFCNYLKRDTILERM